MYRLFVFRWMKYPVEHPQRKKSYLGVMLRVRLQKKKKIMEFIMTKKACSWNGVAHDSRRIW